MMIKGGVRTVYAMRLSGVWQGMQYLRVGVNWERRHTITVPRHLHEIQLPGCSPCDHRRAKSWYGLAVYRRESKVALW